MYKKILLSLTAFIAAQSAFAGELDWSEPPLNSNNMIAAFISALDGPMAYEAFFTYEAVKDRCNVSLSYIDLTNRLLPSASEFNAALTEGNLTEAESIYSKLVACE